MVIARLGAGLIDDRSADTIGAKAANLARMAALGLPVPPAFVLPVSLCAAVVAGDQQAETELTAGLAAGIEFLEAATGRRFGDRRRPLLVSVRSGAAQSMPGMLDTVLDVGCTPTAVHGLIRMTGNPRFAWDCRRRLLEGYAEVVLGLDAALLDECRARCVTQEGVGGDRELDTEALERLAGDYQALIEAHGDGLPEEPALQLAAAARAVYRSWMSARAVSYRRLQGLDHLPGTAVTVQAMVYGNRGLGSGAGVAFSRDPSTGIRQPVVDVIFGAQGEDVVSGRRSPDTERTLALSMPAAATALREALELLEREYRDVQDVEFTIEDGTLWLLQTRRAKRTPRAAMRIAIDLVGEGLITPREGLERLAGLDLEALGHATLVAPGEPAGRGIGASGGVAAGRAAFDPASAERLAAGGEPVILMRPDTSTEDVAGFAAAAGIVTTVGARTAHAALVARQMNKPCVVGCSTLAVEAAARRARLGALPIEEGDWVSIDGDAGLVFRGQHAVVVERPVAELETIAGWRLAAQPAS